MPIAISPVFLIWKNVKCTRNVRVSRSNAIVEYINRQENGPKSVQLNIHSDVFAQKLHLDEHLSFAEFVVICTIGLGLLK